MLAGVVPDVFKSGCNVVNQPRCAADAGFWVEVLGSQYTKFLALADEVGNAVRRESQDRTE